MSSMVVYMKGLIRLLCSPDSGLRWLSVRFCLAGGLAMVVYVLTTTLATDVAGLSFQVALALGFYTALCINFVSQRRFVWAKGERYLLPIHHQAGRYLLMAMVQYGVTVAATLLLPHVLGIPTEAVYLAMIVLLGLINFLILRYSIFHAAPTLSESAAAPVMNEPGRRPTPPS
jgi:putative flippase GtrA